MKHRLFGRSFWDGGIDVRLGDPLNGYAAEDKVSTFAEAATWLRDQACAHYPDSEFARKYGGGFV